jgi:SOS response regulatory protein OraA/RecX
MRTVLDVKRKLNEDLVDSETIKALLHSQIAEAQQVIQRITEVKSFLNDFTKFSKDTPLV